MNQEVFLKESKKFQSASNIIIQKLEEGFKNGPMRVDSVITYLKQYVANLDEFIFVLENYPDQQELAQKLRVAKAEILCHMTELQVKKVESVINRTNCTINHKDQDSFLKKLIEIFADF